ncbi:catalase [Pelomonas sp. SE-A7]|uniref:catalase n=1 Tax=Pelomonas sp. SE-A7 TaxID=3054953 RepID=UPI00259D0B23|nr:catalase [Pelomonas sp. SE-A7]MDM4768428.1 catalase [Pelomonas sp. SE-A7]
MADAQTSGSNAPSTGWKERIGPDEAARYAGYVELFKAIQARKNKRYGPGRALHRKQLAAARGELQVMDGLPDFARHGLFAQPGRYEAVVRLSNGGMDTQPDKQPDIRGLALKVKGLQGPSALGEGLQADSQSFLLINQTAFSFKNSQEFVGLVEAASKGGGAVLGFLVKQYGWLALPGKFKLLIQTATRPFGGFATEPLNTVLPLACGPYAVRVRLVPAPVNGSAKPGAKADWGADFMERLAERELSWELQLQPFVNEQRTPIEDPAVDWDSPYTTVALLRLPRQALDAQLVEQTEKGVFDLWNGLAAHRPLGEIQRARKAVYYASQQERGAG